MGEIGLILHAPPIATNAVLTDDLPEGARIATASFEDVLEIGRHARTDMDAAAAKLAATGVPACAIACLNAGVNPDHERAMAARLRVPVPGPAISCSHEVSPEIHELERTAATALNALPMPVIAAYGANLRRRLADAGIGAPAERLAGRLDLADVVGADMGERPATSRSWPRGGARW